MALARSRRRWGLAVTCACVVRHCACVLASPMGADSIGRGPPDLLGLNLPDRVFRLIGHKPRLGAGRLYPGPVSVGDSLPAFIIAPSGSPAPVREHDAGGSGGGFAALGGFCRRVAGVSRL